MSKELIYQIYIEGQGWVNITRDRIQTEIDHENFLLGLMLQGD